MSTKVITPKTRRKPKANDFKSILEQFLEKYNLSTESSPEQLNLLTQRKYSKEKKGALLPDKRKEKLTIEKRAEYCAKAGNKWQFQAKLAKAGVDPEIINNYARDPALIQQSNKIQKEH
ncbi:hypothetical protein C1646_776649 [Rhizophagus diaphanus]|nr:hypothetical protein C1646_776649 [Rhizophagus diaphanus] [Rhizophagus sp. MUCL 43196]